MMDDTESKIDIDNTESQVIKPSGYKPSRVFIFFISGILSTIIAFFIFPVFLDDSDGSNVMIIFILPILIVVVMGILNLTIYSIYIFIKRGQYQKDNLKISRFYLFVLLVILLIVLLVYNTRLSDLSIFGPIMTIIYSTVFFILPISGAFTIFLPEVLTYVNKDKVFKIIKILLIVFSTLIVISPIVSIFIGESLRYNTDEIDELVGSISTSTYIESGIQEEHILYRLYKVNNTYQLSELLSEVINNAKANNLGIREVEFRVHELNQDFNVNLLLKDMIDINKMNYVIPIIYTNSIDFNSSKIQFMESKLKDQSRFNRDIEKVLSSFQADRNIFIQSIDEIASEYPSLIFETNNYESRKYHNLTNYLGYKNLDNIEKRMKVVANHYNLENIYIIAIPNYDRYASASWCQEKQCHDMILIKTYSNKNDRFETYLVVKLQSIDLRNFNSYKKNVKLEDVEN